MIQILVAIIGGIVGPIVVEFFRLSQQRRKERAATAVLQGEAAPAPSPAVSTRPRTRGLMDLAIILVCEWFFSGAARRLAARLGPNTRDRPWACSSKSSSLRVLRRRCLCSPGSGAKPRLGVESILSITTLAVLLLSPGGPLNPAVKNGERGLHLTLPVLALLMISGTSAIYLLGNPLDRNVLLRSRRVAYR